MRKRSRNSEQEVPATPEFLFHRRQNRTCTYRARDFPLLAPERVTWSALLFSLHRARSWPVLRSLTVAPVAPSGLLASPVQGSVPGPPRPALKIPLVWESS